MKQVKRLKEWIGYVSGMLICYWTVHKGIKNTQEDERLEPTAITHVSKRKMV